MFAWIINKLKSYWILTGYYQKKMNNDIGQSFVLLNSHQGK